MLRLVEIQLFYRLRKLGVIFIQQDKYSKYEKLTYTFSLKTYTVLALQYILSHGKNCAHWYQIPQMRSAKRRQTVFNG